MININDIKKSKLEEFSIQRKNLLRLITQRIKIGSEILGPITKNSKGGLYKCFKKFETSEQNLENIYDLVQKIVIDESEMNQVEKSLVKKPKKRITALMSKNENTQLKREKP
jgi:hypothetical protein